MKKIISIILTALMLLPATAFAADDEIKVILDGERIEFDVQPVIENERTLVPMRAIFEAMGKKITWVGHTESAWAEDENTLVYFWADGESKYISKRDIVETNGERHLENPRDIEIDVPARVVNGRTLVPLRAIAEAFDCDVQWDDDTRTVNIETGDYETQAIIMADTFFSDITNNTTKDENYVISPFSLKIAMSMLAEGAEGETEEELSWFIRHGIDFGHGNINLKFTEDKNSEIKIANSIWFNKSVGGKNGDFSDDFKEIIKKKYFGTAEAVTNKDSVEKINEWVDKQTKGKITNLLGEEKREYLLALVNTIYMKADWEKPFESENTYKEAFTDINGNQTEIDFMHRTDYFEYYEDEVCKAVNLPYTNGLNMCIVVGSDEHICGKLHMLGMENKKVNLSIPKFKIEYSTSLNDLLKAMDVKKAFEDHNPDFNSMVSNVQELKIDEVLQKVIIEVDEKGTEAAAATAVLMAQTGMLITEPEEIVEFKADEPFSYFIYDNFCGDVLFAGRYVKCE